MPVFSCLKGRLISFWIEWVTSQAFVNGRKKRDADSANITGMDKEKMVCAPPNGCWATQHPTWRIKRGEQFFWRSGVERQWPAHHHEYCSKLWFLFVTMNHWGTSLSKDCRYKPYPPIKHNTVDVVSGGLLILYADLGDCWLYFLRT
jgi:hypothetical protein